MPREVRLLIVARAVNRLGAFSLSFLTVLLSAGFGASPQQAGLISAAFGLATIPSRLLGGYLADRIGRRTTIVLGLAGCAAAQLGIAASGSVAMAAVFAVLLGLAFEIYEPPSQAMVADAVGPEDRPRAYSLFNAALAAAGLGAGLIAATVGRWDLRWLFVADALSCLACALVVRLALPPGRLAVREKAEEGSAGVWRDRALLVMLGCGTLFATVYMQVVVALPLAMAESGLEAADAGVLLAVSAVTIVACQPFLRVQRATVALTWGALLMAAGLAGYAVSGSLPALIAWTVVWSVGDALMAGRPQAVVAGLAPVLARGRYLSVYGLCWGVATMVAPITATQLLAWLGAAGMWAVTAATCLLMAAVQAPAVRYALRRGAERERPPTTPPRYTAPAQGSATTAASPPRR